MSRTDRASRVVHASPERVFTALVDRRDLESWLPPHDMTGRFEWFDPTPGGGYRLVLTYPEHDVGRGKSTTATDVVAARYVDIVPGERVVQSVVFDADDPAFAGTMVMTWSVEAVDDGTLVRVEATGVPDGISPQDHADGMAASLANLARLLER